MSEVDKTKNNMSEVDETEKIDESESHKVKRDDFTFYDKFNYKNYNGWILIALIYGHLAAVYGIWLIPSAQWKTLVFGNFS